MSSVWMSQILENLTDWELFWIGRPVSDPDRKELWGRDRMGIIQALNPQKADCRPADLEMRQNLPGLHQQDQKSAFGEVPRIMHEGSVLMRSPVRPRPRTPLSTEVLLVLQSYDARQHSRGSLPDRGGI